MRRVFKMIKPWIYASALVTILGACASSNEQIFDDAVVTTELSTGLGSQALDGADASGVEGADASAIADEGPLSATEMLEQSEGDLSNRTVYFEFDSAKLTDESLSMLEQHGAFVAANRQVTIRLEGHTDERGSREYNVALGDRRAQSVRRVLLFQGASVDQIDTVSYGEEQPALSGHNEDAWARNRRVELLYSVN